MAIMIDASPTNPWRLYWGAGPLPEGSTAIGTVTREPGDAGALLRMATGIYVQGNAAVVRTLPQTDVVPGIVAGTLAECEAEARRQGHDGDTWEPTVYDCDLACMRVMASHGRKPRRDEWPASLKWVGDRHYSE